eukprot:Sdes_comp20393_c0_seq1m14338
MAANNASKKTKASVLMIASLEKARSEELWETLPSLVSKHLPKASNSKGPTKDIYSNIVVGEYFLEISARSLKVLSLKNGANFGGEKKKESLLTIFDQMNFCYLYSAQERFSLSVSFFENVLEKEENNEEALILSGIFYFRTCQHVEALKFFEKVEFPANHLSDFNQLPTRLLKLRMTCLWMKSACLDRISCKSAEKPAARNSLLENAIRSYAKCIQVFDFCWSLFSTKNFLLKSLKKSLEICLYRIAILQMEANRIPESLASFRRVILKFKARVSQAIYHKCLEHIAELNLKLVDVPQFQALPFEKPKSEKPLGDVFVPQNPYEEAILCLMICLQDCKKTQVFRSKKISFQKNHRNYVLLTSYLTFALYMRGAFQSIVLWYEKILKFCFQELFLWFQFSFVLLIAQNHKRAYLVMSECKNLNPSNVDVLLHISRLVINGVLDDNYLIASQSAESAVAILQGSDLVHSIGESVMNRKFLSKAYLCVALSHKSLAAMEILQAERKKLQKSALLLLHSAFTHDANSPVIAFHLASMYSEVREIEKAFHYVRLALHLNPFDLDSIQLLAILFSSSNLYQNSLDACATGFLMDPDNFNLLFTQADIFMADGRFAEALKVYKQMLDLWHSLFSSFSSHSSSSHSSDGGKVLRKSCRKILLRLFLSKGMYSITRNIATIDNRASLPGSHPSQPQPQPPLDSANRGEETAHHAFKFFPLGDVLLTASTSRNAASGGEFAGKEGNMRERSLERNRNVMTFRITSNHGEKTDTIHGVGTDLPLQYTLLTKIWLSLSHCFLHQRLFDDAQNCLLVANELSPQAASCFYTHGLLKHCLGDETAAQNFYESALAVQPGHVKSLIGLGRLFYERRDPTFAERYLNEAIELDSCSHIAWFYMGLVLKERGRLEVAAECFSMAITLEQTNPASPFDSVPKPL